MTTAKIAEKKPVKVTLKKGQTYCFCTCGHSQKQPFCDGTHREKAPEFKSLRFEADKEGEVWLCQCKQTDNAPFCDGTHKKL